jgi:hypothetical protein
MSSVLLFLTLLESNGELLPISGLAGIVGNVKQYFTACFSWKRNVQTG